MTSKTDCTAITHELKIEVTSPSPDYTTVSFVEIDDDKYPLHVTGFTMFGKNTRCDIVYEKKSTVIADRGFTRTEALENFREYLIDHMKLEHKHELRKLSNNIGSITLTSMEKVAHGD